MLKRNTWTSFTELQTEAPMRHSELFPFRLLLKSKTFPRLHQQLCLTRSFLASWSKAGRTSQRPKQQVWKKSCFEDDDWSANYKHPSWVQQKTWCVNNPRYDWAECLHTLKIAISFLTSTSLNCKNYFRCIDSYSSLRFCVNYSVLRLMHLLTW